MSAADGGIRLYESSDQEDLLSVWKDATRLAHPFWTEEWIEEGERAIVEQFMPIAETWVMEKGGRVVGFVAMLGDTIGGLFVAPAFHGRGIGRALVEQAGSVREQLDLEVFEVNEGARAFYERCGFEQVGVSVDEKTGYTLLELFRARGTV